MSGEIQQQDRIQFEQIRRVLFESCGIWLGPDKNHLVRSRLSKRVKMLDLRGFEQYVVRIKNDPNEFSQMVNALSTNTTNFFRGPSHFDLLENNILPGLTKRRLRIWCAGCSTGEEPYSIAMLLADALPDIAQWDIKILATDISSTALDVARQAEYSDKDLADIPAQYAELYLTRAGKNTFRIGDNIRKFVSFARLNLMDKWTMGGPFDVIFCRNVLIYFDRATQEKLVGRFYDLVDEGSHFFVGQTESLTRIEHKFRYIEPAAYKK